MGYRKDVIEAGRCLASGERSDWRLAELTHQNTRRGAGGSAGSQGERVSMERWCADVQAVSGVRVRFGPATGLRYARIWALYGTAHSTSAENGPSFKDAYAEVDGTPDRGRMMEYEAKRLLEQGTPAQKAEAAAALMNDPDVQEAAVEPATPVASALDTMADRVTERRLEEAGKASVRGQDVQTGIKKAKEDDLAYQYARLRANMTAFFASYEPDTIAEALFASRHAQDASVYADGAQVAVEWFGRLRDALTAGQRRGPRLVPQEGTAS
jgi:hypothetical protein